MSGVNMNGADFGRGARGDGVRRVGLRRAPCRARAGARRLARARRLPPAGSRLPSAAAGQRRADHRRCRPICAIPHRWPPRCAGPSAVVNLVGILAEGGKQKFSTLQAEGAKAVAEAAVAAGVDDFVHVSAIGADASSASVYARTKAEGEAAVLAAVPTRGDPAPVRRLRPRGRVLQPLRRHGALFAGHPGRRRGRRASSRSMSATWRRRSRSPSTAAPRPARPMSSAARR